MFSADSEFSRRIQTWRGTEPEMDGGRQKLARIKKAPKPHKPRTGGSNGGRPVSVHIDRERLQELRDGGNSWEKCGEYFGCSGERARQLGKA